MRKFIFRSFQLPHWRFSCAHLLTFTQTNLFCNLQLQPPSSSVLKDRSTVVQLSHRASRMAEMPGKKPIVPAGQRGRPSAGGPSPHGRTPQQPTQQHQDHHHSSINDKHPLATKQALLRQTAAQVVRPQILLAGLLARLLPPARAPAAKKILRTRWSFTMKERVNFGRFRNTLS